MNAPKLFSDEFYLFYLKYVTKAALNVYSLAVPIISRSDIRSFYSEGLAETVQLMNKINDILLERKLVSRPPMLLKASMPDLITDQDYLNGYFGKKRPLHALEITHLYDNIENNAASKAVLIGFSQVAEMQKVKNFFIRGTELTKKHYDTLSAILHNENLPVPKILDDYVLGSTEPPFSDRLLLFHKIDMFTMRIRSYGNALSFSARHDLAMKFIRMTAEAGNYLEDGANILIDNGWFETPPKTVDRKQYALT